jgi:teichuronic acid biosynthesis glycosyltransferase TuaC
MRLRILVVTAMYPHPGNVGSGAFVMQQVEQIRALGHQVDVLHFPGYRSRLEYLKAAAEVSRRTHRERYDVLHAHYGVTGLVALFRSAIPLVVSLHGSDALVGWHEPLISRIVCKLADATIVASRKIADRIPGEIIPCGVDLSVFEPKPKAEARRRLNLESRRKYILFPFNPARSIKRFDLASAAVAKLAQEGLDVELVTVSKIPNGEMPWHYSASDTMILCSDSEGSPTAVKEALACNLPVVSTDVGDMREITRGVVGVEIAAQTPDSLARCLKRVLYPPTGFVFNGRAAMERYSQSKTAEAILRVYRRVIDHSERAAARNG